MQFAADYPLRVVTISSSSSRPAIIRLAWAPPRAGFGRNDRLLAPSKIFQAQFLLQLVNLHAQRGLGNKTLGRLPPQSGEIGRNRENVFQLYQGHLINFLMKPVN